jgi:hypothetical protein
VPSLGVQRIGAALQAGRRWTPHLNLCLDRGGCCTFVTNYVWMATRLHSLDNVFRPALMMHYLSGFFSKQIGPALVLESFPRSQNTHLYAVFSTFCITIGFLTPGIDSNTSSGSIYFYTLTHDEHISNHNIGLAFHTATHTTNTSMLRPRIARASLAH